MIGQALAPDLPEISTLTGEADAAPPEASRPSSSEVSGPLLLPGLPGAVAAEEYDDPGDLETEVGQIMCSTLYNSSGEHPRGVTDEMIRALELDKPLKVAFVRAVGGDEFWSEHSYLTRLTSGVCYELGHLASGELTPREEIEFPKEVRAAEIRELRSWYENHAFRVCLPGHMVGGWRRPMSSRWVLAWKTDVKTGLPEVRARLCVRGFLDAQAAVVATIAAMASMLIHKLFAALATDPRKILISLDVSAASLKGISFGGLNQGSTAGSTRRAAHFSLPSAEDCQMLVDLDAKYFGVLVLRFLEDVCVECLKGGFGLWDAPRLWALRLHRFFLARSYLRSCFDGCAFFSHTKAVLERHKQLRGVRPLQAVAKEEKTEKGRRRVTDLSKGLFQVAVNTHVDDTEALLGPPDIAPLKRELGSDFGPVKVQMWVWKHVGSEYGQAKIFAGLRVWNRSFAAAPKFYPVPRDRRPAPAALCDTTEHSNFRSSIGGATWFCRWHPELLAKLQSRQTRLAAPTVLDLIRANSLTRDCQEAAQFPTFHRALASGRPLRQTLFVDAGKGGCKQADKYPTLAHILLLQEDNPSTLDGGCQPADWRLERSTRVGKSSLHVGALAAANGVDRAETVSGILEEECYVRTPHIRAPMDLHEAGAFAVPTGLVTDSKSLFDLLVGLGEPKPADEGSSLYLLWVRGRIRTGAIRRVIWCCTQDRVADCSTKENVDPTHIHRVTREGRLELHHARLTGGKLLNPEKGLPAPKTQRGPAAALFCEAWHAAGQNLAAFTAMLQP